MDENSALSYMPLVAALIEGSQPESTPRIEANYRSVFSDGNTRKIKDDPDEKRMAEFDPAPNSLFVMSVSGPLTKNGGMCSFGTSHMSDWIQEADSHPNIAAHVLRMATPGGTVEGTEHFASVVRSAQKPVVVLIEDQMCSGGYWIGSQASYVMVQGATSVAGSIGTMISIADMKPLYEKNGVKFHTVKATQSTDKGASIEKLLAGDYEPIRKEMLDPMNAAFIGQITQKRPQIKPEALTGKVFLGQSIIEMGLADSMGSFQDAVQMAYRLTQNRQIAQPMSFLSKFFDTKAAEASAKGQQPDAQQIAAQAEQEVERITAENGRLTAENEQLQQQMTAQAAQIAQINERLNGILAENERLRLDNQQLGERAAAPALPPAPAADPAAGTAPPPVIALLDVEAEAKKRGATVDHSSFQRVKGVYSLY